MPEVLGSSRLMRLALKVLTERNAAKQAANGDESWYAAATARQMEIGNG